MANIESNEYERSVVDSVMATIESGDLNDLMSSGKDDPAHRRRPDTVGSSTISDAARQVVEDILHEADETRYFDKEQSKYWSDFYVASPHDPDQLKELADEQSRDEAHEGIADSVTITGYAGKVPYGNNDTYAAIVTRNGETESVTIEMSDYLGSPQYVGIFGGYNIGGANEYDAANRAVDRNEYATMDEALTAYSNAVQDELAHNTELEIHLKPKSLEIQAAVLPYHDRIHPDALERRGDAFARDYMASQEKLGLQEEDGRHVALVLIPHTIQEKFSIDILNRSQVDIQADDWFQLKLNVDGDKVSLDRQFNAASYQGRFEDALFKHHEANLNKDAAILAAEAAAARHPAVKAEYSAPAGDIDRSDMETLKVSVGNDHFDVEVRFDEAYQVVDVQLAGIQDGYDFESDDGARGEYLASLVRDNQKELAAVIQDKADTAMFDFMKHPGWDSDESMDAGYCVIAQDEVDRLRDAANASGKALIFEQGMTVDGQPVDLVFDMKGRIEEASATGSPLALRPVIEGSHEHMIYAKAELSDDGISLTKNRIGEYKVDFVTGTHGHVAGDEGSAYYTDDLLDAVGTAREMVAQRELQIAINDEEDRDRLVSR